MSDTSGSAKPVATNTQTQQSKSDESWAHRLFGDFRPLRVIGGFVLAILVIASAGCAVVFFAASQFQSRIADLSLNGAPLTIWRVAAFRGDFQDLADFRHTELKNIEQDRINLANDKQKNIVQTAKLSVADKRLMEDATSLNQRIVALQPQATIPSHDTAQGISDVMTRIEVLLLQDEVRARFGDEFNTLKKRQASVEDLRAQVNIADAQISAFEVWNAAVEDRLKGRIDNASKLFGASNSASPELVERIVNATAELTSLQDIWQSIVYHVALWTNDMVVLLLLISMGVLGSALNLLAIFIANESDSLSFGEYPLRLAFGAVLAIVMFIVAKAGIPILADTSKISGNTPLNPYFISLLAIVSGLMSDRAMSTIRNVATSLLQSVGGADYSQRYTRVGLDDTLKAANRDIDGLAGLLGMKPNETKDLFSGKDPVSPDRQKLISAFLNQPIRDLFSDMPAG